MQLVILGLIIALLDAIYKILRNIFGPGLADTLYPFSNTGAIMHKTVEY